MKRPVKVNLVSNAISLNVYKVVVLIEVLVSELPTLDELDGRLTAKVLNQLQDQRKIRKNCPP